MSFAPLPVRSADHPKPHGIKPVRALHMHEQWGEQALQRTWRTGSVICLAVALAYAFLSRVPAIALLLASIWAHFKANPTLGARLAAHPIIGAPWRWWIQRGRHQLPAQARDTTPQM
jgi:hypothetical protein